MFRKTRVRLCALSAIAALSITACATRPSPLQDAAKLEIGAEALFQVTVSSLNTLYSAGAIDRTTRDTDAVKAWNALQDVRTQYRLGKVINTAVLAGIAVSAKVPPATVAKTLKGT